MISNSVISHCSIGTSERCRLLWNWQRLVYLKRRWFMEWDEWKVHIVEREGARRPQDEGVWSVHEYGYVYVYQLTLAPYIFSYLFLNCISIQVYKHS